MKRFSHQQDTKKQAEDKKQEEAVNEKKKQGEGSSKDAAGSSEDAKQNKGSDGLKDKSAEKEEPKVPKVRVVAYSDSDSDVEDHFEQVKAHLLPAIDKLDIRADGSNKKHEEKKIEGDVADEQEAKKTAGSIAVGQFLSKIAAGVFGNILTVKVIIGGLSLSVLEKKVHPRAARVAEGISGGLFALDAVLSALGRRSGATAKRLQGSDQLLKAAILYESFKWMFNRQKNSARRIGSHVDLARLTSLERLDLGDRSPASIKEFAGVYNPEMREMRRILAACDIVLPDRFDEGNEEFFRFAKSCGLLEAETADDRAKVIEKSIRRVIQTVDSVSQFKPLPENRLKRWERVVSWRGIDSQGHPVLVVRLGRALQLIHTETDQIQRFVDAIKSQVDLGVLTKLKDSPMGRMVVVVDCREITAWGAISNSRQITTIAKQLTSYLASHYPERLEKAYLIDVSMMVSRMLLSSVMSSLDEATKGKIIQTTSSDESLPVTLATLQKTRSFAAGLSSRLSDPSMATSTTSNPQELEELVEEEHEESYHTPHAKSGVSVDDQTPEMNAPGLGSYALRPTPLTEVSLRDRLLSTASSIDSLDLASHLSMYPWSGMDLMLVLLWQKPRDFRKRAAISPTGRSGMLGFSRDSSFQSLDSPVTGIKGGLLDLPQRIKPELSNGTQYNALKTRSSPTKPSIRRESSLTEDIPQYNEASSSLGSHPLPRQSSVSWAETLVNIREIDALVPELSDEKIHQYVEYYLVALLLSARIISACLL